MIRDYLNNTEATHTISSLIVQLDARMTRIKQKAETLAYDEVQHPIASLCVYVVQFKQQILDAEKGIDRFIDNSADKRRSYLQLDQDLLRLISILSPTITVTNATAAKCLETLNRVPKMERSSNFNVIKISAHYIDIQYVNKALVIPSVDRILSTAATTTTRVVVKTDEEEEEEGGETSLQLPQIPEILQLGTLGRETILIKVTNTMDAFQFAQKKIRIYLRHYAKLGNKALLGEARSLLHERLDEVVYCVQEMVTGVTTDCCITEEDVNDIKGCFDEMLSILELQCANCSDHVFNTITRFTTCSTDYARLLVHLRHHKIDASTLHVEREEQQRKLAQQQNTRVSMHSYSATGWGSSKWD